MLQGGASTMVESGRDTRAREGQRGLQAARETILAQVAMPLASGAMHQPPVSWVTQPGTRPTLYLWLADEEAPRRLAFPRALIEDGGAGVRLRHAYARSSMVRSLKQMGLL